MKKQEQKTVKITPAAYKILQELGKKESRPYTTIIFLALLNRKLNPKN